MDNGSGCRQSGCQIQAVAQWEYMEVVPLATIPGAISASDVSAPPGARESIT